MTAVKTQFSLEPWDRDRRLHELGLDLNPLLNIIRQVIAAGAEATPDHAVNAEGTYRYQAGVVGLRRAFKRDKWVKDRENNIEAIRNDDLKIKIAFTNVDLACKNEHEPQPRSKKGKGAEQSCSNKTPFFPGVSWEKPQDETWRTFYLMVDKKGAAELSQPIVSEDTFTGFIERIFLLDTSDHNPTVPDGNEPPIILDPQVSRK
ncbi:MAG: hypothetical protein OXC62_13395 [Aestuariivita sp.]|nr:hypothetical protein [Aestuariivita sp.]